MRKHSLCIALCVVAGISSGLVTVGCTAKVDDSYVQFTETTADALDLMTKPRGTFGFEGAPNAVWLDPRTSAAYEAGHIPGAISLPFARLDAEQAVVLKDVEVIVLYDADFQDDLVKAVAKRLIELGHKEVYVLRGGLKAWRRDGNPIEAGPPPAKEETELEEAS
jgi:rhodanese-related sulfurtransferase